MRPSRPVPREARLRASRGFFSYALFLLPLLALSGCGSPAPPARAPDAALAAAHSDADAVRAADYSVLFVGNSHTGFHDLPDLVCRMIGFGHPERTTYPYYLAVSHLDVTAHDPRYRAEIETRPWKYVVLQAQKISSSGKYDYSRQEGIDLARLAKANGAKVLFFAEWGRKGVADEGPRTEAIYRQMADAAGVDVAPVGRAWDAALAARPDLPLHDADGNHQAKPGAFLTAAVLSAALTGDDPQRLAGFAFPEVTEKDRAFLAQAAAQALGAPRRTP